MHGAVSRSDASIPDREENTALSLGSTWTNLKATEVRRQLYEKV
jgi:hypothetical protein